MKLDDFKDILPRLWTAETSATPTEWSRQNPARGQSAVTAALAAEVLHMPMRHAVATLPDGRSESHYLNWGTAKKKDGPIDFTRSQFPLATRFSALSLKREGLRSTRTYVLSFAETLQRYAKLRDAFQSISRQPQPRMAWLMLDLNHTVIDAPAQFPEALRTTPAPLMRGAGMLVHLAVTQGYRVGILAEGDEVASRFQLSQLPFTDQVSAVLVAPKLAGSHIRTFMHVHGVDPALSVLVGRVTGDGRSTLAQGGLTMCQYGESAERIPGVAHRKINRLQDALLR